MITKRISTLLLLPLLSFGAFGQEAAKHSSPEKRTIVPIDFGRRLGSPWCEKGVKDVIAAGRGLCDPNHLPTVGAQSRPFLPNLDRPAAGIQSPGPAGEVRFDAQPSRPSFSGLFDSKKISGAVNPFEVKTETSYSLFMPDILLLYEMSLVCDPGTPFTNSLKEFWEMGMKPSQGFGVKATPSRLNVMFQYLHEQSAELEKLPPSGLANAVADEISVSRLTTLSKRKECSNAKLHAAESTLLKEMVLAFHQKLQGKTIRTQADLYALASDDEKRMLNFLYGERVGTSPPADFFLEWDRANYFRNLLVNGEIAQSTKGYSLSPLTEGGDDLFQSDLLPREKLSAARSRLADIAAHHSDNAQFYHPQEDRADPALRPYYHQVLSRLEERGVFARLGEPWKAIAAERLRSYLTSQLAAMDHAAPHDTDLLKEIMPQEKVALITAANKNAFLGRGELRAALSHPLTADHTAGLNEGDLQLGDRLHQMLGDERFEFQRATDLQKFRPEVTDLMKRLESAQSQFRNEIWSDYGASTPHFYGRQLSSERNALQNGEHLFSAPLIDRIAAVLRSRGLGLNAQDRIALQKDLNLLSLELLAKMLEHTAKDDRDGQARLNKDGFHANFISFDELAQVAYAPAGKNALVQTMALISRLNQGDSDEPLRELLQGVLAHSSLVLPEGVSIGSKNLSGRQRDLVAEAAEKVLLEEKNLGPAERDALALVSMVMRARGHDSKTLYGDVPDAAALTISLNSANVALQAATLAQQKALAVEAGEVGQKLLDALKDAKASRDPELGLPIGAEGALLTYLGQSPDLGPSVLRQLQANLSPKRYAELLATAPAEQPEIHLAEALRAVSPRMHHLLTDGIAQRNTLEGDAVREIMANGEISASTAGMLPILVDAERMDAFSICAKAADSSQCVYGVLYSRAVMAHLEAGQAEKADDLLKFVIPDSAMRAEHLAAMKKDMGFHKRIRSIAECSRRSVEELIRDPSFMERSDTMTGAEAMRRRALSRWQAQHRGVLSDTMSDAAVRARLAAENQEFLKIQRRLHGTLLKQRRDAYPKLSDKEFRELVQRKSEAFAIQEKMKAMRPSLPKGRSPRLPAAYTNLVSELKELETRIAELTKSSGFYWQAEDKKFSVEQEKKLKEVEDAIAAASSQERRTTNSPQQDAWGLLALAHLRSFPARAPADQDPIPLETRVARLMQIAQNDPEFSAKLGSTVLRYAQLGFIAERIDGSDPKRDDAATKELWDETLKITQYDKSQLPLQEQLDAVLKQCQVQETCPLSPTELEYLKELYAKHGPQGSKDLLFNADHTLEEHSALQAAENAHELEVFRRNLMAMARSSEPVVKEDMFVETLPGTIGQNCPEELMPKDGELESAYRHQLMLRRYLHWGRSIADGLVSSPNAHLVKMDFARMKQSPKERDAWLQRVGGLKMAQDWVFRMSSGTQAHKMSEDRAWSTFMQLIAQAAAESMEIAQKKKKIEAEFKEIGMTPTGESVGDLWKWDAANLHKVSDDEILNPGQKFTRSQFMGRLNQYYGLVAAQTHALNPNAPAGSMGEDELHRKVHDAFMEAGYQRDAAALGPRTVVRKRDSSAYHNQPEELSGLENALHYEFKDYTALRPEIEARADRARRSVSNNGDLFLAIGKSGGAWEMTKRAGIQPIGPNGKTSAEMARHVGATSPLGPLGPLGLVSTLGIIAKPGNEHGAREVPLDTANDHAIGEMFNEYASTMTQLSELGSAKITYDGHEVPADQARKDLALKYAAMLSQNREMLEGILKTYGTLSDEILPLLVELAAGGAIFMVFGPAGVGIAFLKGAAKLMKYRKLIKLLNRYGTYGRLASGSLQAGKVWWLKQGVDLAQSSYKMAKTGAAGSLWALPANSLFGAIRLAQATGLANKIDKDHNGVPDWQEKMAAGQWYEFPEDVRAGIDIDNNGVPDSVDVLRGMPPAKYTVGGFTDIYESAKSNALTMTLAPGAGKLFKWATIKPINWALAKAAPKLKSAPFFNSFEMAGGMFTIAMANKHGLNDGTKSFGENFANNSQWQTFGRNFIDSAIDSGTGMAPIDDLWATYKLNKNPNISPAGLYLIKSLVNHGQDGLQGIVEEYRNGFYTTANKTQVKGPFWAALASMMEGAYLSQKASNPKNTVIDALPKIIADQVISRSRAGEVNIQAPLLDYVLIDTVDKKGNAVKQTVRDLIAKDANLGDFNHANSAEAFMAIFSTKLVQKGVPEKEIKGFFKAALAKTPVLERHLGEVEPFLSYIVREKLTADVLAGTARAEALTRAMTDYGALENFHRQVSAVDVVTPGTRNFKNEEIARVVEKVATDYGLAPGAFKTYVANRVANEPNGLNPTYSLGLLAREMRNRTRY